MLSFDRFSNLRAGKAETGSLFYDLLVKATFALSSNITQSSWMAGGGSQKGQAVVPKAAQNLPSSRHFELFPFTS
jgi:hypothetical protein